MQANIVRRPYITASLILVAGLGLLPGGMELLMLGGSAYYLLSGVTLVATAILLATRSEWAFRLFAVTFATTLVWALWEVGPHFWLLLPRMSLLLVLTLLFLLPRPLRISFPNLQSPGRTGFGIAMAGLLITVAGVVIASRAPGKGGDDLSIVRSGPETEWRSYGNSAAGTRFVDVNQITPANVGALQVAWTYRVGDIGAGGSHGQANGATLEVTPLKIGKLLYICTASGTVTALDAVSGRKQWRFKIDVDPNSASTCRGVSYAEPAGADSSCPRRIYMATNDARLFAINAATGRPCAGFGKNGEISLLEHMGVIEPGHGPKATSPPVIAGPNVILGMLVVDNQSTDMPSGVVRSFDAVTGKLRWAWDMGAADRIGAPEEGQRYTPGTPNAWAPFSVDEKLGLVYVPTGNPSPDLHGGKRRPFDEKYGSSIVALDLTTGRPRWSFQTVHHDVWDYDVSAQPVLVDLPRPAVVVSTKQGQVFVLDRRTGAPILPVTERPAPRGTIAGEKYSPTQPWSALSLSPAKLTERDMWGLTAYDQLACRVRFKKLRYEGLFTPPGLDGAIMHPGSFGVSNWQGVSVDPRTRRMIATVNYMPFWARLLPRDQQGLPGLKEPMPETGPVGPKGAPQPGKGEVWFPMTNTPYFSYTRPLLSSLGVPCNAPPWGEIAAFDLTTGKQLWRRPTGTTRDKGPLGMPMPLALPIGAPGLGGTVLTSGGLVFNAGTLDNYIRAYSIDSGEELWRSRLPAGGQATPMTYRGADGRQYVVIAAGGHRLLGTTPGNYLIAYALPK